jgi:hypothetical protein
VEAWARGEPVPSALSTAERRRVRGCSCCHARVLYACSDRHPWYGIRHEPNRGGGQPIVVGEHHTGNHAEWYTDHGAVGRADPVPVS